MDTNLETYINNNYRYHNGVVVVCEDDFEDISKAVGLSMQTVERTLRKDGYNILWTKKHSFIDKEPIKENLILNINDCMDKSLQGNSLRESIGRSLWGKLRRDYMNNNGCRCEICGYEPEDTKYLQLHEIYELDKEKGIIKVVGFQLLCKMCHSFEHSSYNLLNGRNGINDISAKRHFMAVNDCNYNTYLNNKKMAYQHRHEENFRQFQIRMGIIKDDVDKENSDKEYLYEIPENLFYAEQIVGKLVSIGKIYNA